MNTETADLYNKNKSPTSLHIENRSDSNKDEKSIIDLKRKLIKDNSVKCPTSAKLVTTGECGLWQNYHYSGNQELKLL